MTFVNDEFVRSRGSGLERLNEVTRFVVWIVFIVRIRVLG